MSMLFGVRYEIDPPGLKKALQHLLTKNGWMTREDGAVVAVFPSAQDMASEFDKLARSVGARPTARFVFQEHDDRFIPVLPVIPDI